MVEDRYRWVARAYDIDYYTVVDKKQTAKRLVLSGIAVPVIIPLPVVTVLAILIMIFCKRSYYKIVNPISLYHRVVKKT